jgi:hypothetical protein
MARPHQSLYCRVFYLLILCFAFSCGDKNKKMLTGEWKLVAQTITCDHPIKDSLEAEERRSKNLPVFTLAQQSEEAVRKGRTYVFDDDGKYSERGRFNFDGNYELADSGLILSGGVMDFVKDIYTFNTFNDSVLDITKGIRMRGHMHSYKEKYIKVR